MESAAAKVKIRPAMDGEGSWRLPRVGRRVRWINTQKVGEHDSSYELLVR